MIIEETVTVSRNVCEDGCGASVEHQFKPGHDTKLQGALLTEAHVSDMPEAQIHAITELVLRGWWTGGSADYSPGRKVMKGATSEEYLRERLMCR